MGTLVRREKTWRYSARKVMEFSQLMIDILVNVSCKFEVYILKIAQVINENVRIAFLNVLSIFSSFTLYLFDKLYNTIQYNTILQYNTIQRVYKLGSGKKPVGLIQIRFFKGQRTP